MQIGARGTALENRNLTEALKKKLKLKKFCATENDGMLQKGLTIYMLSTPVKLLRRH